VVRRSCSTSLIVDDEKLITPFHIRSAGGTASEGESVNLFASHNHLLVLFA
jgi:hypothetical protein